MNKDKEPLMSFNEWESLNPQLCDLIPEYAKYHTQWHLKQCGEVVCEDAMVDDFTNYPHSIVDRKSITNAIENYIKENL